MQVNYTFEHKNRLQTLLWSQNKKSHVQTTRHIYVMDVPVARYAVINMSKYTNNQSLFNNNKRASQIRDVGLCFAPSSMTDV